MMNSHAQFSKINCTKRSSPKIKRSCQSNEPTNFERCMILAVGSLPVQLTIYQFFKKTYPEKEEQVNLI